MSHQRSRRSAYSERSHNVATHRETTRDGAQDSEAVDLPKSRPADPSVVRWHRLNAGYWQARIDVTAVAWANRDNDGIWTWCLTRGGAEIAMAVGGPSPWQGEEPTLTKARLRVEELLG